MNIKSGDIIQSNRWSEPVEINLLEDVGEYVRLVGVTIHSRGHIDQLLHRDPLRYPKSLAEISLLVGMLLKS